MIRTLLRERVHPLVARRALATYDEIMAGATVRYAAGRAAVGVSRA